MELYMAGGRPSKYDPEVMPSLAAQKMREGYTREMLAEYFGVHVDTIYEWSNVHPEFSAAIKESAEYADAQVENALRRRALDGDTTAQIFWLKNRQPKRWRDVRRTELTGEDGGSVAVSWADLVKEATTEQT